jgi:hypothetical protein
MRGTATPAEVALPGRLRGPGRTVAILVDPGPPATLAR